jgi:hypothetical protein
VTWEHPSQVVAFNQSLIELNFTGIFANYTMQRYQTNTSTFSIILPAGTFCWKVHANDSMNQWNSTPTSCFTIGKAPTKLDLVVDGTSLPTTVVRGEVINITANLNVSRPVSLKANFTGVLEEIASGPKTVVNLTDTSSLLGSYLLRTSFAGDQNYSSALAEGMLSVVGNLRDYIMAPCQTALAQVRDSCNHSVQKGLTNLTFGYKEIVEVEQVVNETLRLAWGRLGDPIVSDASWEVVKKAACASGDELILRQVYASCSKLSCNVAADGGINLLSTIPSSGYEANITFEIEACNASMGNAYDLSPLISSSETKLLVADSFIVLSIQPEKLYTFPTQGIIRSSQVVADVTGDGSPDIVMASVDSRVYALNASNGAQLWNFSTG